jgi:hypothetical protein
LYQSLRVSTLLPATKQRTKVTYVILFWQGGVPPSYFDVGAAVGLLVVLLLLPLSLAMDDGEFDQGGGGGGCGSLAAAAVAGGAVVDSD